MADRFRVLWVNLLVTAGLLLALELASRLIAPVGLPDPLITGERADWSLTREYDPLLFWRMQPGIERDGERLTNSRGLRGPEVEAKAPDELRILSLGESTTFGIRLSYEETYSARLEELLTARLGRPVRVVNAGVPGYTLFQGVTWLRHRGLELEPDAVLTYFGHNDFLPVSFRRQRDAADRDGGGDRDGGATDRVLFERRRRPLFRLADGLARHSNFARLLLFRRRPGREVLTDTGSPRVPAEDRRRLLAELVTLARNHDFRLVIVVPWYLEFEAHVPLLREFASEQGVPTVDLPHELADLERADYFVDPLHPSAAGHERMAAVLAAELAVLLDADEPEAGGAP